MPTIRDVAQASGVSIATVSQVLNNGGRPVSHDTRQKVFAAARRLNYHPNSLARGLIRGRTDCIGLVYLHAHRPLQTTMSFKLMLDGILDAATEARQNVVMCTSYAYSDGLANQSSLLDQRCDGHILLVPPLNNQVVPELKKQGIPVVLLCSTVDDPSVTWVDTDNRGASEDLATRLIKAGHRRIAFMRREAEADYSFSQGRLQGYRDAFARHRIEINPAWVRSFRDATTDIKALMALPDAERPTAICASSDSVALEVLSALTAEGWRVPDDIQLTGFDDVSEAQGMSPGLTTVHQPLVEIGKQCVRALLDQIQGRAQPGIHTIVPTRLVVRESAPDLFSDAAT